MTLVLTIALAVLVFAVAGIALSIKVILGNRTPLKEHACDVMCRHGKGHPCTCTEQGTCSDYPEGHPGDGH